MSRISKGRRVAMTKHVMQHLHGRSQPKSLLAPPAKTINKVSAGAAKLGARFVTQHATSHHGRRTIPVMNGPVTHHAHHTTTIPFSTVMGTI